DWRSSRHTSSSRSTTRGSTCWSIPVRSSTRWSSSGTVPPRRNWACPTCASPAAALPALSPPPLLPLDPQRFPAVGVARRAGGRGGVVPAVLNAANEVCVDAFLRGACRFDQITELVGEAVEAAPAVSEPSLQDVLDADAW